MPLLHTLSDRLSPRVTNCQLCASSTHPSDRLSPRVTDCQLCASSAHPDCRVTKSRLNSQGHETLPDGGGAWCLYYNNDIWIQVGIILIQIRIRIIFFENGTNFGLQWRLNIIRKFLQNSSKLCQISTFNCFFLRSVISDQ